MKLMSICFTSLVYTYSGPSRQEDTARPVRQASKGPKAAEEGLPKPTMNAPTEQNARIRHDGICTQATNRHSVLRKSSQTKNSAMGRPQVLNRQKAASGQITKTAKEAAKRGRRPSRGRSDKPPRHFSVRTQMLVAQTSPKQVQTSSGNGFKLFICLILWCLK